MQVWLVYFENEDWESPHVYGSAESAYHACQAHIIENDELTQQERDWSLAELSDSFYNDKEYFGAEFECSACAQEVQP